MFLHIIHLDPEANLSSLTKESQTVEHHAAYEIHY
jgi:hypothetical protein